MADQSVIFHGGREDNLEGGCWSAHGRVRELCRPDRLERRTRSLLSKLTSANHESIAQQLVELDFHSAAELRAAAHLVVCKALAEPFLSEAYCELVRALDHIGPSFPAEADNGQDFGFTVAVLDCCAAEFEDLLIATLEAGPSSVVAPATRPEFVKRPEGVCLENDYWRSVKRSRRLPAVVSFIGHLVSRELLPSHFALHVLRCLVEQRVLRDGHPVSRHSLLEQQVAFAEEAPEATHLLQIFTLSGECIHARVAPGDTSSTVLAQLARGAGVEPDRARLLSGSVILEPDALLSELPCTSLQLLVLPSAPREQLVECICSLLGLVAEAVVGSEAAAVRCVEYLTDARQAADDNGRPVLSKRAQFQVLDVLDDLRQHGIAA